MNDGPGRGPHGCNATAKGTGQPCRNHPGPGGRVCWLHGGKSPQAKRKAAERVAQAEALKATEKYGIPVRTTVAQALQDELALTTGVIRWLLARVQELPGDQIAWGTSERRVTTNPGQGALRGEPQMTAIQSARPHVYVTMLDRERHHLAQIAADMARIGIEAHAVRVAEVAGGRILQVLEAYAAELGHDPRDMGVRTAAVRALAAVPDAG